MKKILPDIDYGALLELPGRAPLLSTAEANYRRIIFPLTYRNVYPSIFVAVAPDLFTLTAKGQLRFIYDAVYADGTLEQTRKLHWREVQLIVKRYVALQHHERTRPKLGC